jgi:Mg-chelatase subunit ChlD
LSFLSALALFGSLLAVLPFVAHRLRRRAAAPKPFGPVHLLSRSQPEARRRARLEDRGVFAVRVLSVLVLALLGASPFVRCSRLSLSRGGASVALALVVDDSLSMRARDVAPSRFAKAKDGALDLLSSLREGDEVAIVLAGAPPRVALSATSDLDAVRAALMALTPSDRSTDLEGALALSRGVLASRPHVDKRIVLLSDGADGNHAKAPLGAEGDIALWNALPALGKVVQDCAVVSADRAGRKVQVALACSEGGSAEGRKLELLRGDKVLQTVDVGKDAAQVVLGLADDDPADLDARLSPPDLIPEDDVAPVMNQVRTSALAVISEASREGGGAAGSPLVEQALRALPLNLPVRSLPVLPDQAIDLRSFAGIVIDDPPGFTPEQRRALSDYMNEGGLLLLALGRRAESAPLGASFDPILASHITVLAAETDNAKQGELAPARDARFAEAALQLRALAPKSVGKGVAYVLSLPLRVEESELPLRPGFLMLLDRFAEESQAHLVPERITVGAFWSFPRSEAAVVTGPSGPVPAPLGTEGTLFRAYPPTAGRYHVVAGARKDERAAQISPAELDFRPRAVATQGGPGPASAAQGKLDVSWAFALGLLALMTVELVLRMLARQRGQTPA